MKLEEFLVKAKVNTYASIGEGGEKDLEDSSKEFLFEEDGWKYRDRYFGSNSFAGEEAVWKDGKIIWVMNYYGRILSEGVPSKEVYGFLKKSLKLVKTERPFRGPDELREGDFRYSDKSSGLVEDFSGIEEIYFKEEKIYELKYHGGEVK